MASRYKLVWPLLSGAALLVSLTFAAVSQADKKANPAPKKAQANPAAAATLRFDEAQALRQAFVVLAGGDHDYNGHRVKAMAAVKNALKILDDHVLSHGTQAQQAATKQGQALAAAAEAAQYRVSGFQLAQQASDARLRQAGKLLMQMRGTMTAQKQNRILTHVNAAIQELGIALKTQ